MNNKTKLDKIIPSETLDEAALEQVSAGSNIGDYKIGDTVRFSITINQNPNIIFPKTLN